jgi:aspartate aminotransferase-like enzyme
MKTGRCGDGSLAAWFRTELRNAGFTLCAPEAHASSIIVTIQLPPTTNVTEVGAALEQRGYIPSHRSGYLAARNWIQFSFMGSPSKESLSGALAHLCDLASPNEEMATA